MTRPPGDLAGLARRWAARIERERSPSLDFARIRDAIGAFEAELHLLDPEAGYRRNWGMAYPIHEPVIDLELLPLSESDDVLWDTGARLYAAGLATADTSAAARLAAGTGLDLATGTNAGCGGEGWEASVFRVLEGEHRGVRVAFLADLRWGLGPSIATSALRGR